MSKWVPAVASIGLICIMVLPTPGVLGIAIGTCCLLAIVVSAVMMLFERMLSRVTRPIVSAFRQLVKPKTRSVHPASLMTRKR